MANAQTLTSSDVIAQSRVLSRQKNFDDAEKTLQEALKAKPSDTALRLEIARVHSWQGRYAEADSELLSLLAEYPNDADIRFARANLLFYQGKRGEAAALLQDILRQQPANSEVRDTLTRIEQAQNAMIRWQLDVGGEYSAFSRQNRSAWNGQFLQLSHFFDDEQTSVYGRLERYWQFDKADMRIETGAVHRFSQAFDAYATVGYTPDAAFKPEWTLAGGGAARLTEWAEYPASLWFTLDVRHDGYAAVAVDAVNPGLRLNFTNGWALSGRAIVVTPDDAHTMAGWLLRADSPIWRGWSGFAGVANAPETVAAQTIDTISFFGGLAVALNERLTLRLSYAREDRQDSYIRHVFALGISQRF